MQTASITAFTPHDTQMQTKCNTTFPSCTVRTFVNNLSVCTRLYTLSYLVHRPVYIVLPCHRWATRGGAQEDAPQPVGTPLPAVWVPGPAARPQRHQHPCPSRILQSSRGQLLMKASCRGRGGGGGAEHLKRSQRWRQKDHAGARLCAPCVSQR